MTSSEGIALSKRVDQAIKRRLLTLPSPETPENPEKQQTLGTVIASHKMLTLQTLSSSLIAGTAQRGCLSQGKAFG